MKRLSLFIAFAMLSGLALSAQMMMRGGPPGDKPAHFRLLGSYQAAELAALRSEVDDKTMGELSGKDLLSWSDRMSVAGRKDAWVGSSAAASFMFPGMGQFRNKDSLGGGLFAAAHLATMAGTLVAAYWLLPADLQFAQLNYYSDSCTTIKDRWEGTSIEEFLPSAGALAGGMAVGMIWRVWSAHAALKLATSRIDEGTMTFEPVGLPGGLGFMLRY